MTGSTQHPRDVLSLLDWKRRVFDLYRAVRAHDDPRAAWELWRATRDELFSSHEQSPLPVERQGDFPGVPYFDYDSALRFEAELIPTEPERYEIASSRDGVYAFNRFARAALSIGGRYVELEIYWLEAYGGGVFVPFRDATSGKSTYGAGRYLLDTVKGADLGSVGDALVLDFNFAYNPSCSYDPRWDCPLAPPPNWLPIAIEAGERYP
ncbi:MAG: DUF1684 domain-containing protein [Actinomycetota bacterium]